MASIELYLRQRIARLEGMLSESKKDITEVNSKEERMNEWNISNELEVRIDELKKIQENLASKEAN